MLWKSDTGDKVGNGGQLRRRFKLLSSKMTGSEPVSPYKRMDKDAAKKKRFSEGLEDKMDKENIKPRDVNNKKQKKKRSWKRFRQVALSTCRYIGMGMAHMSPATVNSAPDYYIDPKHWNRSFSPSYNMKMPPNMGSRPYWTNNMMFMTAW
ncbi:hypothetical protein JTE90_013326 [Oedothorax gibbosus]|uniref:Uncharacterized protein n=1 Tax=Oedothorax gibbosus TaxID=931172 RepID=A0AAV6VD96_9ARAC|nr:hypothetical protein JTE90_013326 [Oedothorax gibbosus]